MLCNFFMCVLLTCYRWGWRGFISDEKTKQRNNKKLKRQDESINALQSLWIWEDFVYSAQSKSTEAQFVCQQSILFLVLVPSAFLHQVNIYIYFIKGRMSELQKNKVNKKRKEMWDETKQEAMTYEDWQNVK